MTKDIEREAFESWFESRYDANFMQFALDLDMYVDKHTQTSWEAWQAAKAQAVPDGFVVVPREPTFRMSFAYQMNSVAPISDLSVSGYKAMLEASQEPAND